MVLYMEMDIGSRLKEARESKGLSLEEIQETTKIQKRYLNAIENNDFKTLPGKFYTRAFIREYASAVGLNPEEIMEDHKSELPSYEDEEIIKYSRTQRARQQTSKPKSSSKGTSLFPRILTGIVIIAIAIAIYVFFVNMNDSSGGENDPASTDGTDDAIELPADSDQESSEEEGSEEAPAEEEPAEESTDKPAEETNDEEAEEPAESEVKIELTQEGTGTFPEHVYTVTGVSERTATIELTGQAYLEATSPKGENNLTPPSMYSAEDSPINLDFSNQDQLYLKTGSVPNTKILINGEPVPFPNDHDTQKVLLNFE
ncbi:helix-turn-helix domain-containing protein [Halobacillus salinus]|uniref:Helix-turn-helix domain-containing protein n=2 Tax=Halobacillus salinus TaxID=192814 RepID=A0A4Z0H2W3_9BACI|nr:helix-turn-helix domain-containing protein [Halobacillus salinus]